MFVSSERDDFLPLRCARCGAFKPASAFAWRRRALGQLDTHCRPCRAAYKREHHLANRERYIAGAKRRRETVVRERMRFLIEFFGEHPCSDCGETDPIVLEFDHLANKEFDVSAGLRTHKWETVL